MWLIEYTEWWLDWIYGNFHKTEKKKKELKLKLNNLVKDSRVFNCIIYEQNKTYLALLWSLSVGRRSLRSWFLHPQLSRIPTPRSRFLAATWNQRRDLWAANFLPPNRYTCKSKHATQWKSHTRARKKPLPPVPHWLIDDETIGCTRRGADVSRFSIENFLRHLEI